MISQMMFFDCACLCFLRAAASDENCIPSYQLLSDDKWYILLLSKRVYGLDTTLFGSIRFIDFGRIFQFCFRLLPNVWCDKGLRFLKLFLAPKSTQEVNNRSLLSVRSGSRLTTPVQCSLLNDRLLLFGWILLYGSAPERRARRSGRMRTDGADRTRTGRGIQKEFPNVFKFGKSKPF